MFELAQWERYIWWLTTAGYLFLLLKIWKTGLFRTYRFFAGYLLFRVVRSLILALLPVIVTATGHGGSTPFANNAYAWTWMATQPVLWFLYILVVLELYTLVLQSYKGLASLGRWVLMGGLALALILSALTLPTDLSNPGEQFPILRYFVAIGRGVVSSLVVFLLLITAFLAWYPVPLSRNVVVHCVIYAIYFLSASMTQLIRNLTGNDVTRAVNIWLSGVTAVCLLAWLVLLSRKGEEQKVSTRRSWSLADEEALVGQLAAVNSTLLRAGRK